MEWTRWMSYWVTRVMDTPFLPAEREQPSYFKVHSRSTVAWRRRPGPTCSGRSSHSVDVDLGEPRGVVVDDHLHGRDVQTPGNEQIGEQTIKATDGFDFVESNLKL